MTVDVPLIAALAALPLVLVVANLPVPLVLPAIATLAFVIAAIAAGFGWAMQCARGGNVTIFDFAGACVLIGVAAGVLSEPYQVSQFFGAAMTAP